MSKDLAERQAIHFKTAKEDEDCIEKLNQTILSLQVGRSTMNDEKWVPFSDIFDLFPTIVVFKIKKCHQEALKESKQAHIEAVEAEKLAGRDRRRDLEARTMVSLSTVKLKSIYICSKLF